MKMGRLEKYFVNRPTHAERNIGTAERLLHFVDMKGKRSYLEVGCGNGHLSKYIAQKYPLDVTGVDVDPQQIQFALESIGDMPNIRFLEADATNLPFQENDFDVVLSIGTTHHISGWLDALQEIRRVLKPGGYLIYVDLVYPKWLARIGKLLSRNYGITTMDDILAFVEKNSLSTIHSSLSKSWYEAVYQIN